MNETMGSIIARLRREKGMTQEQLANAVGISYQAVSKWENELSSPDISALPLLADIFGVSVDALFGRESAEREETALAAPGAEKQETTLDSASPIVHDLPWPDDEDTLHVVLYAGHRLIGREGGEHLFSKKQVTFQYEGPALNIESDFNVTVCGNVDGGVTAGGDVKCDMVGGDVRSQGDVTCDTVGGSVSAGGDVTCDTVGGQVEAGGDVSCDDVYGNVSAGGDVSCGVVRGGVTASGDVSCGVHVGNGDPKEKKKGFSFGLKF